MSFESNGGGGGRKAKWLECRSLVQILLDQEFIIPVVLLKHLVTNFLATRLSNK